MIFNQLFDPKSHTYTYIISSGQGREALIVDPVIEKTDEYLKILENLELKLVKVIDTHIHADHISGLNELNKKTSCTRIMGDNSPSEVVDIRVKDGEKVKIEDIELLRALEIGLKIKTLELKGDSFSVDIAEDYSRAKDRMQKDKFFKIYK